MNLLNFFKRGTGHSPIKFLRLPTNECRLPKYTFYAVLPAVVLCYKNKTMEEQQIQPTEETPKYKNREGGRIIGGLILVGVGAVLLMRNMGYYLPEWLFSWPMILILIGIYTGVKHRFQTFSWIALIGIGGFFLADDFIPNLNLQPAFWPVIIIAAGIMFILRPKKSCSTGRNRFRERMEQRRFNKEGFGYSSSYDRTAPQEAFETETGSIIKINSVFSGINRSILSKNFRGGKIACVFGGAEIDFMQADIHGTAVIKIEMVFGGVKIIVPQNWTVINEVDGVFHGVEDKRYKAVITDPDKVLVLKGSAVFAGIDIRSY